MPDRLPLAELAGLPEFYHPVASPDGEHVAVYWDGTGRNELHVIDAETDEMTRLTDGEVPRSARWPVHWGPDGEQVFFHLDDDGDEQNDLWAVSLDGDAERVVSLDGQCVLQSVTDDSLVFGSDAGEQMNLYRCALDGSDVEKLTDYDLPVWYAPVAPDGERIAYATNESDDLENRDAYVADADGGNARRLPVGEDGAETYPVAFGPAGDRLLLADDTEDLSRCGVYDLAKDEVTWYGTGEFEEAPVAFRPDGSGFLATRTREAGVVPVFYGLDGDSRELDFPEGVASLPHSDRGVFVSDDAFVVSHTATDSRKQLYRYDLSTDEREVLLEADYGDLDPADFASAEYVTYESPDGLEIGALLYDSGERPSPAVVRVHGGPHAQFQKRFDPYAQFLVSRGYSVLMPNYRGSTGRGREFKNRIHGDWGGREQEDVAAGARWLKRKEWTDDERIAVYGGSFGGYSVYVQLTTRPDLWTTGIASVGITDLHALYEDSMPHFRSILEEQMGDPEDDADLWRERSPITHVEAMGRPIQMIHGVNDPRCPVSQARRFRDALEERGWTEGEDGDFEYEELGEEGHGSTDIDQKIRTFRLVEDYLDRRL
ncbi:MULTISPECIES: prolyl oligopeptidase family serine peptidase [Halorussus]|uniref:S9 family peptidase n=1 Tax=Halorussus TaxID=1070314 RepID=UPI00209F2415|nr:prolyl oligopeptidase family serine peptidase [Halorussus vallis]USZ76844.1 prolyl oligopeptidase family serine peptidase [Halorussus vallis]